MDAPEDRFRRLFDACYPPLCAYARRRLPAEAADDLVAEVLTVAWRRLPVVPDGDGTLPWLYAVAHGILANQRRGLRRRLRLIERIAAQPVPVAPSGDGSSPEDAGEQVRAALARLRPDDQEILRLRCWEDLTVAEIATVLGCGANAASLRLSRARARLRAELTDIAPSRTEGEWKVTDA